MGRSLWKFKFFSTSIWRKIFSLKKISKKHFISKNRKKILYDRASNIPHTFKGFSFYIHKGTQSRALFINKFNVGMKFGEFAFTRKPFHFPLRKKKGRNVKR